MTPEEFENLFVVKHGDSLYWDEEPDLPTSPAWTIEQVEDNLGKEPGHDECYAEFDQWIIWKLTHSNGVVQFFRKPGVYASFDGTHWDPMEEVHIRSVVIERWVRID